MTAQDTVYNVLTDEDVGFPSNPPPIAGSAQLRMRAIEAAVQATRQGLGFNVIQMAESYLNFALGKPYEPPQDMRGFRERLREMMEREILSEATDLEKLRHDVQEVFGEVEDAHWPKIDGKPVQGPGPPWPKAVHSNINDPAGPEEGIPPLLKEAFKGMAGMSHSGAPDSSAEGMTVNFAAMGDGK